MHNQSWQAAGNEVLSIMKLHRKNHFLQTEP
jgi:hypothetical protein